MAPQKINRDLPGYQVAAVESWAVKNIAGLKPPFEWTKLEGGHSNLTYRLEDSAGKRAVIRRPPEGELLPKAHDMSREWSLIEALADTSVPVPTAYGFCEDPSVTGAHFYVMGLINGNPLYNANDTLKWIPESERSRTALSFIDILAALHNIDPEKVGLGNLGKKDSYIERQLKTWYRSWNASIDDSNYDNPRMHELQEYLLNNIPEQGPARIVHGDYGLHNVLIGPDHTVSAVIDWEISTLGDPLADLGYALNWWPDPEDSVPIDPDAATAVSGFPSRSQLAQRYAQKTGQDLSLIDYYLGFNHWKIAAIIQGVYARYAAGKKSSEGVDLEALQGKMKRSITMAVQSIDRLKQNDSA